MVTFVGTAGDDTFTGDSDPSSTDVLIGLDGNDSLDGAAGLNNSIFGGAGDDILDSAATGSESLDGGDGDDTITSLGASASITGGGGIDVIFALGDSAEVDGGDDSDVIAVAGTEDSVLGGAGDDVVESSGVDTSLDGGIGDDSIVISQSVDAPSIGVVSLTGGDGTDTLDISDFQDPDIQVTFTLDPTDPSASSGTYSFVDADTGESIGVVNFASIENVIFCFTPGTLIATARGEVPVETLRPGARVLTRDHGMQELAWVGRRELAAADLVAEPRLAPVLIRAGALGPGRPERDMMLSPQHRVLVVGPLAQLHFAESEVLVAAKHLVGRPGIERLGPERLIGGDLRPAGRPAGGVSYVHLLFEQHEVIRSDAAWTESFQPGDYSLGGLAQPQRDEVLALFPELASAKGLRSYASARPSLSAREAGVLLRA